MTMASSPGRALSRPRIGILLTGFVTLVFCAGTAEYLVAGLLPQVAADLGVSVAVAGQIATAYALGVAIGGPLVTLATARLPRKRLTLALFAVFAVGTLISGLAPSFPVLLVGRVLAASSQATLFAIALVLTTTVVAEGRAGRAVAIVTSGLTVATVLGVPLGAFSGEHAGWRAPFFVLAILATLGAVLVAVTMPRAPAPATGAGDELRVLLTRPVLLAVATTVVGFASVGVVFTYLVPLLTEVTGIASRMVPALLLAYGIGGFAGNLVSGRLTDLRVNATLRGILIALAVLLTVLPFAAAWPPTAVIAVLGLGLMSTATIAPLQTLLLRHAAAAPTLAVAVNVGAFNLANAAGATLGGISIAVGLLRWNGLAGAVLALAGLVLATTVLRVPTRAATPAQDHSEQPTHEVT